MKSINGVENAHFSRTAKATDGPHILFVLGVLAKGGAEITMLTLARGLRERGHRVTLATYGRYNDFVDHAGPNVEIIKIEEARTFAAALPIYRLIRRLRPNVLVTALTHTNVVVLLAAAAARVGARVVVTEHGQTALDPRYLKKVEGLLLPKVAGLLYARADEVVAVSKGLAGFVESLIPGRRKRPIRVIYNPVVGAERAPSPDIPHPWLSSGAEPVIISVGRLQKEKDFAHLIRAFALVAQKRAARLVILGEGDQGPELQALALELGVNDRVLLPGFTRNVQDWLHAASVFVCTSRLEAFGNAIVEAMACGLTVVSVDCPHGPAEILEHGRYGYLVPMDDVDALASAIGRAVDHPLARDLVRARAATFNETQCFDGYDQLIRNLCHRG